MNAVGCRSRVKSISRLFCCGAAAAALHNECTAGRNAESSEGSSFTDAFSGSNFESEVSNEVNEKADILQETLAVRTLSNFITQAGPRCP